MSLTPFLGDAAIRVLVASEDQSVCQRLVHMLGGSGMEAMAHDGLATDWVVLREVLVDVVVIAAGSESRAACDAAHRIRTDPELRNIPVVMIDLQGRQDGVVDAFEAGASDYLIEPVDSRELDLRIRVLADMHRGRIDLVRSNEVRGELTRGLEILFELSRSLAIVETLDELLQHTLTATVALTGSSRVVVLLPSPDRDVLHVAAQCGLPDGHSDVQVRVGCGLAGHVFASGETIVAEQPEGVRCHQPEQDAILFIDGPLLAQPLCSPAEVIGVLCVSDRCESRFFDARDIEYLDLIGNIAASAIDDFQSRQARDQARDSIVTALATLAEYRDADTGLHLDRVTAYAMMLADELRKNNRFRNIINAQFLSDLRRSIPLHDVGKVAVPDHILLKPGRLTDEEMALMRTHTETGARAIRSVIQRTGSISFLVMAERIASEHHEWYDGSGYPSGLQREEIHLASRIAAVSDVYDALTTKRPYKEPLSHEHAVGFIKAGAGTHFDPAVTVAFLACETQFASLANELADPAMVADAPEAAEVIIAGR
jgi:response regulator RpfG family c-di-GMP phosphodiesterase